MTQRLRAIPIAVLTLLAAAFVVLAPTQVEAQNQGRQTMPEAPPIEDGELRTFAHVYLDVAEVRDDLESELEETADQAEAQQLQQAAQAEMRGILEESELTIERYTQIGQILNVDPEQRAEFQALVEEIRQEEGDPGPVRR